MAFPFRKQTLFGTLILVKNAFKVWCNITVLLLCVVKSLLYWCNISVFFCYSCVICNSKRCLKSLGNNIECYHTLRQLTRLIPKLLVAWNFYTPDCLISIALHPTIVYNLARNRLLSTWTTPINHINHLFLTLQKFKGWCFAFCILCAGKPYGDISSS